MFLNSVSMAEEMQIAHLHVFPYSPRPETPAARMPQLDRALIKERAARLRDVGDQLHHTHLVSMVGTVQNLLVERGEMAHTENFTLVATPAVAPGALVSAIISGHNGKHLLLNSVAQNAA